jgi:type II secretory pathway pseudopilin PulG
MRSVTCAGCGLVGWADGDRCKRCGCPLPVNRQTPPKAAPTPPDYNAGYNAGYSHTYGPGDLGAPAKKRMGYAIASLVIGIIGFFTLGILLIGTIVGTSLGIAALKKQGSQPALYGGKGIAVAGIVMNIAALFMIVPIGIISAIAIPNLLAARRAANEASAISALRVISSAEATYSSIQTGGSYGDLIALKNAGLIDDRLASSTRNGYVFTVTVSGNDFEMRATPLSSSHGSRSFYTSAADGGEIHVGVGGLPANALSPTIESMYGPQQRRAFSQPGANGMSSAPAYY